MTTNKKTAIIIGAGISGLSTGCYLQMNGYQTKIVEMYSIAGGCCTAWDIKGYRCDYCIGWMPGCGDLNEDFTQIWRELGALQNHSIIHVDIFNSVVCDDGTRVNFYVDPDKLQQHLLEISPVDKQPIEEFCAGLRKFIKFIDVYAIMVLKPEGLLSFSEKIKYYVRLLPYIGLFMKTGGIQMTAFADKFQSPAIRLAMNCIFYTRYDGLSLLPFLNNIAFSSRKLSGCPEGGSLELSASIAKRYQELGGEIIYNQKISKILVQDNQAIGVRNSGDEEYHADYVVSAMDGYKTIMELLEDKYTTPSLKTLYKAAIEKPEGLVFQGVLSVFLGVNIDLTDEIHSTTYFFTDEERQALAGVGDSSFSIQIRTNIFPSLAPAGKSLVLVTCLSDHRAWEKLDALDNGNKTAPKRHTARKRSKAYQDAKKVVADIFTRRFLQCYPQAADKIEMTDVSTPLTVIRYTGSMGGALLGWVPFAKEVEPFENDLKKQGPILPDLKNFYMAGQWVQGGGLITTASSGRHAAQYICANDGRDFVASEPN
jgi:phytoene dehydrogenase-like protein